MTRGLALLAGSVGCLLLPAPPAQSADAGFRPFADSSPWNTPAALAGYVESVNPYAAELGSLGRQLRIEGIPPDVAYGKPIFFAEPGDPTTTCRHSSPTRENSPSSLPAKRRPPWTEKVNA